MSRPVFTNVKLDALVSLPFPLRSEESDEDLIGLSESVSELGMLEPILVRPSKDRFKFEIVAGERRVRAARKAGLKEVPAIVQTLSDEEAYLIQLTENAQRKDLPDMDKAHALDRYLKTFHCTQEVLAKKMGKTQQWVSYHVAMLQLPPNLTTRVVKDLTEKQAREILAAPPEKQVEIVDEINRTGEVPSTHDLHLIVHPEQKPATVLCDHCGEPVTSPVHIEGKFYHDDCVEDAKAASLPGLAPESAKSEPETRVEPEKKAKEPEPLLTGYAWTCPCGAKFIINHVDLPDGKKIEHYLEACGA